MLVVKIDNLCIELKSTSFDSVCDIDICLWDYIYDIVKILLNNKIVHFSIIHNDVIISECDVKLPNYDLFRINGHITREYVTDHIMNILKSIPDTYYTKNKICRNGELTGPFYYNGKEIANSTTEDWLETFYNNIHSECNGRLLKDIRSNTEIVIPMWCV